MPRIARKNINTPFVHVMVQGINKEYIFENKNDIELYLSLINKNIKNYKLTIMAYCMMNNHAHFLIYTEDIKELGRFMKICNLQYVQIYNRERNRVGVLFRNRYRTEPIYNTKYLINCIKYIHENPVKAKIVDKCEDYKYSSYNDYKNNVGVTQSKIVKEIFGEKCNYLKIFNESFEMRQIDVSEESEDANNYISEGIKGYKQEYHVSLEEILSNREVFIKLLVYLKENCHIKYTEIMNFFEISKSTLNHIKGF